MTDPHETAAGLACVLARSVVAPFDPTERVACLLVAITQELAGIEPMKRAWILESIVECLPVRVAAEVTARKGAAS